MSLELIKSTAEQLSLVLVENFSMLKTALPENPFYAIALVVTDDFSNVDAYANTTEYIEGEGDSALSKWYWGEWESGAFGLECDFLEEVLGEVDDFDDETADGNAVVWLTTMTEGMRLARQQGAFDWKKKAPTIFCSMQDHDAAVWLEDISAKYLNSKEAYESAVPEIQAASAEWYSRKTGESTFAVRDGYLSMLKQLEAGG